MRMDASLISRRRLLKSAGLAVGAGSAGVLIADDAYSRNILSPTIKTRKTSFLKPKILTGTKSTPAGPMISARHAWYLRQLATPFKQCEIHNVSKFKSDRFVGFFAISR